MNARYSTVVPVVLKADDGDMVIQLNPADKSVCFITRVDGLDDVDNNEVPGSHTITMRRDFTSYFPPRRKIRWLFFGLACAAALMILHQFTAVRTHVRASPDQDRIAHITVNSTSRRENIYRKNFVKQMMQHAWSNYATYAFGENELRPLSRRGFAGTAPFGETQLGLTIIDSLDTLYLMGLHEELSNATDWIKTSFDIRASGSSMSVFEANIRFLGGFLAIHALTGKKIYLEKAIDSANALLPAFKSESGLPWSLIEANSGSGSLYNWIPSECVFLADVGTLHLEFAYLSEITGNPVYLEKVKHVRQLLKHTKSVEGLYPNLIEFKDRNGTKCETGSSVSTGAFGDSFYEYLSKAWLMSGKTDVEAKTMFYPAMEALERHLLQTTPAGLKYFAKMEDSGTLKHEMEHLGCFIGGLYALSAQESDSPEHYMQLAQDLAYTCRLSYNSTASHLGPEVFIFSEEGYPKLQLTNSRQYSLRPEVVETYYYLWKTTGNEMYRDWAWDAAQAMEANCRKKNGYTGISDVDGAATSDNVQQSFFMAETLKYLYLIFLDTDPVPLDKWVFNTEAHPLPVIGSKPFKDAYFAWRGIEFSPLHALHLARREPERETVSSLENGLSVFTMENSAMQASSRLTMPVAFFSILFLYIQLCLRYSALFGVNMLFFP